MYDGPSLDNASKMSEVKSSSEIHSVEGERHLLLPQNEKVLRGFVQTIKFCGKVKSNFCTAN